jgi:hypothetical protein
LLLCGPAFAFVTGAWSVNNGNGVGSANTTVGGIQAVVSGYTGQNPSYTGGSGSVFNRTNYWSDPYGGTVAGEPSLQVNLPFNFGPERTITVTFSKAVDNPVLHVDRLGGTSRVG